MSEEFPFNDDELKLIQTAKRAMMILAKVIRDKDAEEVIKDPDLSPLVAGRQNLEEALADPELGPKIRERLTPDLPRLNVEQEALLVGQLGSVIFSRLIEGESNDNDGPG